MARRVADFQTIRSEGGLLPQDLLRRILDPKGDLAGTRPEDYGLPPGERFNDVITQSWNRLRKHWTEFRAVTANIPDGEAATGLTNDKWTLPLLRELGFGLLPASASPNIDGRTYAISRSVGPVPIHLIGCGLSLDRRAAGVRGAALVNPHGLVQEFLNRSPEHLWALVSNGLRLRILRDNQALSRQSFLEFDLETIFSGEVYSDFVLLWLIAHATRFTPREAERPETCQIEQWTKLAQDQGTRALGDLRGGVETAIEILGEGFTGHPKNAALREALRTGQISLSEFHGQLLRVVYRLIFLFVAEDRNLDGVSLLHPRDDSSDGLKARERFTNYYGTVRLRQLASQIKGSRHGDLWYQFNSLVGALSGDERFVAVRQQLALPILGSFLWDPESTKHLNSPSLALSGMSVELTNYDFLETIRHLAFTRQDKVLRPVDYKNLGAEELGGIYESLLALTPQISSDGARFSFVEFAGSERKTSGSYYTPDSLVQCLLDSALDPVVEEAIQGMRGIEAEKAILSLKVCDPAVGSGHFLVGAAHRLARHLARARALSLGESEPSPLLYQQALRDVIGHCLYGVDMNPMAVELCRVSLWLEALEPGKPLSFLDHHIRVGNSLLGTTPELMAAGLPDEAFTPIEGDDRKVCAMLKKRNKQERQGQQDMHFLMVAEEEPEYGSLASRIRNIDEVSDDTIAGIQQKADEFRTLISSLKYQHAKQVADAWCSAFVWKKQAKAASEPITSDTISRLETNPEALTPAQRDEVKRLTVQYQFFHWHLAFPEVFENGGFDCVLGNPPWERVKLLEKEWFSERSPEIADAPNAAARKQLIEVLKTSEPGLYRQFLNDSRNAEGESHILRNSGRYPFCGRGDINTYAVFAEAMRVLLGPTGRIGCVLPTGIATDDTTKFFFQDLVERKSLVNLFDFENRHGLFPHADRNLKFCLITATSRLFQQLASATFVSAAVQVEDLRDPERRFTLSAADIRLLNPNTRTCPICRSRHDAQLIKAVYRRIPVLIREAQGDQPEENPWGSNFNRMFDMSNDSDLFRTREYLETEGWRLEGNLFRKDDLLLFPLYEAKMMYQFDHRFAHSEHPTVGQRIRGSSVEITSDQHADPNLLAIPRYWVSENDVAQKYPGLLWSLVFRDITGTVANVRTVLSTIIGRVAVGNKAPLIILKGFSTSDSAVFLSTINSFVFDYCARQKLSGLSLNYFIFNQLPVLPPERFKINCPWSNVGQILDRWLFPRVFELIYTAWDLEPFAKDCGWSGPPFRWDEERRFLLRCELDAAFFHLYLPVEASGDWRPAEGETEEDLALLKSSFSTPRDAVAYIMDTFPIVRRKDEEKWGDYRTKHVILEIYDAMAESMRTGNPYQTRLDPPPADPRCCHPPKEKP